ncbi:MAG: hypothetical protein EBU81_13580, partial [Proteobacteria bacterium]|nr:hypothetical protein [Pseudomonadota bacterium]
GSTAAEAEAQAQPQAQAPLLDGLGALEALTTEGGSLVVRVRWPVPGRRVARMPDSAARLRLRVRAADTSIRAEAVVDRRLDTAVSEATMSVPVGQDYVLSGEALDASGMVVAQGQSDPFFIQAHVRRSVRLVLAPAFVPDLMALSPAVAGPGATVGLVGDLALADGRMAFLTFEGASPVAVRVASGGASVVVPEGARTGSASLVVDGIASPTRPLFRPLQKVGWVATGDVQPWLIDGQPWAWPGGKFRFLATGEASPGVVEALASNSAELLLAGDGVTPDGRWEPIQLTSGTLRVSSGRLVATADLRVGSAVPPMLTYGQGAPTHRDLEIVDSDLGWLMSWLPDTLGGNPARLMIWIIEGMSCGLSL